MKQNQKGISMVSLVITIIVIIILAAVSFSGSEETISRSGFSGYVTDIDSVRTAFLTEGVTNLMGDQEAKNNSVTNAQAYNYLAKGATTSALPEDRKMGAWLSKAQASAIPCTYIEKSLAKEAIGIELPKRKVNTYAASGIEISYFVTNKGDIFTWPPYYKEDDGLFYVNDTIPVAGSKVTSGDWLISGDDEAEMYKDGFAFMVNGVEIRILGTGENVLEIGPDTPVEEIRTMAAIAYKDERNAKSPEGVIFEGEFAVASGSHNGGNTGGNSGGEGNEGGEDNTTSEEQNPSGTIPEGAYYANLATGTFYEEMPETVNDGDVYLYGDYLYMYGSSNGYWAVYLATEDWGITDYIPDYKCTDRNQTSYGPILESINGERIGRVSAFEECRNLIESPVLPSGVTCLMGAYYNCTSLVKAPVLPPNIEDMDGAFSGCTSLTDLSDMKISNKIWWLGNTFSGCTNLTKAPVIPDSISSLSLDMTSTFEGCTSLSGTITINSQDFNDVVYCFKDVDMSKITLAGSCPAELKQELANTGLNADKVTIIN